jgi:hypothetical protein
MVSGNFWITWGYIKCIYLEHPWVKTFLLVCMKMYTTDIRQNVLNQLPSVLLSLSMMIDQCNRKFWKNFWFSLNLSIYSEGKENL